MLENPNITRIYEEIRNIIFYMIPEKWDSIYLYATVIPNGKNQENGEMFFYYFPKSILRKNPINVYQIPQKFNIEEGEYLQLTNQLYNLIKKLKKATLKYKQIDWSSITISVENVNFLVEYNCENLEYLGYASENIMAIWQYKYLKSPLEKFSKEQRKLIQDYLEEENKGMHRKETYSENFYQPHMHNNVQYDIGKNEEQYVRTEEIQKENDKEEIVIRNQLLRSTINNMK